MRRGGEAAISPGDTLDLAGLLESTLDVATARFGEATANRVSGEDSWSVYEGSGWSLRIRARSPNYGQPRSVRSWTLTLDEGYPTLADACAALSLGCSGTPSQVACPEDAGRSMLRCALRRGDSDEVYSLTATRRSGRIRSLTAFDEAPDWLSEATG